MTASASLNSRRSSVRSSTAFTLLELLVTIGIIVALAALLLPLGKKVRSNAESTSCLNNLRGMGSLFQLYASDHEGNVPPLFFWDSEIAGYDSTGGRTFRCPSDRTPRQPGESRPWRSYAINPMMVNYIGAYPAYPGHEPHTGAKLLRIFHPSKMFLACEYHQVPGATSFVIGEHSGSVCGTPAGKDHGKFTSLLFVDGHVESIEKTTDQQFTEKYLFNRE